MGLIIKVCNHKKISEPAEFQIEDFLNYQEMMTYLGYFNLANCQIKCTFIP